MNILVEKLHGELIRILDETARVNTLGKAISPSSDGWNSLADSLTLLGKPVREKENS